MDQSEALFTNRLVNFNMNFELRHELGELLERNLEYFGKSFVKSTVKGVFLILHRQKRMSSNKFVLILMCPHGLWVI